MSLIPGKIYQLTEIGSGHFLSGNRPGTPSLQDIEKVALLFLKEVEPNHKVIDRYHSLLRLNKEDYSLRTFQFLYLDTVFEFIFLFPKEHVLNRYFLEVIG